ncbi:anti-sigma factor antagonist [bacterium]|nr:anti-sigma factor antagonist [bacterium]RQV94311.1 MAG: STAS domain-containing protein [bacterium]
MDGIQVSVEKIGPQSDISIIRVGGYIDTTTSSELERALDSLLKAGVVRIIIDLGNVDYISSAGWGIFISEIKGMRERNGDLKLARMIPDVYEVFELLEFHYILKAFDTIEDAIDDFDKGKSPVKVKEKVEIKVEEPDDVVKADENQPKVEETTLSLEDKVKEIALENPFWGASKIAKELNTEKYGFTRVNTLSVWNILRKLNLGGKKRRKNLGKNEAFE